MNEMAILSKKEQTRKIRNIIGMCVLILFVIFWLMPYGYLVSSAFRPSSEVISTSPTYFPKNFSLENFWSLFAKMKVGEYFINSFSVAIISTAISVFLGALASYAIARFGGKISVLLVLMTLCLKMIPTSCIVVPIFDMISRLGIYDTHVALIIVYAAVNMPFVMWTMFSFYEGLPIELEEAAHIDGASSFQTFMKVILPICRPGLATAFIFTMFLAWNDFLISLLLTSRRATTFTVGLANFLSAYSLDLGPMCAGAFLFSFPVMIISIFAQRFIMAGVTAGAVKG
jgi:multiple sugar transport system permease protein